MPKKNPHEQRYFLETLDGQYGYADVNDIGDHEARINPTTTLICKIYEPKNNSDPNTFFYIPGTGCQARAYLASNKLASQICFYFNCRVIVIYHRQAPENKHPIPYNDICEAINYFVFKSGIKLKKVGLAGYSSGALAALLVCLQQAQRCNPFPFSQLFLIAPAVDLSAMLNLKRDPAKKQMDPEFFKEAVYAYLQEGQDPTEPAVSPIYNDQDTFKTLPEMTIVVGTDDLLFQSITGFIEKARQAEVHVCYKELPGENHTFAWVQCDYLSELKEDITKAFDAGALILPDKAWPLEIIKNTPTIFGISPAFDRYMYVERSFLQQKITKKFSERRGSGVISVNLYGASGSGKTQTALSYFYNADKKYRYLFWCNATRESSLRLAYLDFSERLALTRKAVSADKKIEQFKLWLGKQQDLLIVYDNVIDHSNLDSYFPESGSHIIITSICPVFPDGIQVSELNEIERECLVNNLFDGDDSGILAHKATLKELEQKLSPHVFQQLTNSPIAFVHISSFIKRTQCGSEEYIKQYQRVLKQLGQNTSPEAVVVALNIYSLQASCSELFNIFSCCGFLASDNIPTSLLTDNAVNFLRDLREFSILSILTQNIELFSLHDIVRNVLIRIVQLEGNSQLAIEALIDKIHLYSEQHEMNVVCRLLPHLEAIKRYIEEHKLEQKMKLESLVKLYYQFAKIETFYFASKKGIIYADKAKALAVELGESNGSLLCKCILLSVNSHWESGDFIQGMIAANKAYQFCQDNKQAIDNINIAKALHNLAANCHKQGEYSQAQKYLKEAIAIYTAVLESDNETQKDKTIIENLARSNLVRAFICISQGQHYKALCLCDRAKCLLRRLGEKAKDSEVYLLLLNECRGQIYLALNERKIARKYLYRSLEARSKNPADNSRLAAETGTFLGLALDSIHEAIEHFITALVILYRQYDTDNDYVADRYQTIGQCMLRHGLFVNAQLFLTCSLRIKNEIFQNQPHPKISEIRKLLAEAEKQMCLSSNSDNLNSISLVEKREKLLEALDVTTHLRQERRASPPHIVTNITSH